MHRRAALSFALVGTMACSDPSPRAGYLYRVTRVLVASASCDAATGAALPELTPPYLAVRDDLLAYRVFACESPDACARTLGGGSVDAGAGMWSAPVPSFVFMPREPAGSGPCDGSASTWRSGPIGDAALRLEVLERSLTGVPRESDGVCSLTFAESRAASSPCDRVTRYEGERVVLP